MRLLPTVGRAIPSPLLLLAACCPVANLRTRSVCSTGPFLIYCDYRVLTNRVLVFSQYI
mgnify:CR=1 FL=1